MFSRLYLLNKMNGWICSRKKMIFVVIFLQQSFSGKALALWLLFTNWMKFLVKRHYFFKSLKA